MLRSRETHLRIDIAIKKPIVQVDSQEPTEKTGHGGTLKFLHEVLSMLALSRSHTSGHTGPFCNYFTIVLDIVPNKGPMSIEVCKKH